ncbi:hypothetical protein LS66_006165 [Helicobacter sp. MIT 03-1614]|jgi:acyl carrier protein|uniref:Carrier domain-containing protein n=2 Tax=Helicobacter TaxID=209 RepID=Q7VJZ9_HELHP|nr:MULTISPECIES: hypothetical protein [Helicobacter]AAP76690.1 hypothetical protein HH_0093 [Helicobacter hepaticus ATCC 51449]RDU62155.1 hypothetical protein CQA43_07565 [Helicobacter ganmani]TLD88464.1 hypothetical protein LS66_006165 [Helicobacter sp. MIT 03-1614]
MKEKIQNVIFEALRNLADEIQHDELKTPTLETKIYGIDGHLDSLALVSFIADLEEMLSALNIHIVLADEKTMSARNSPFKDVATLTSYILTKVQVNE